MINLLVGATIVGVLSTWTAWYAERSAEPAMPQGTCFVTQAQFVSGLNGMRRIGIFSESYWFSVGRIRVSGSYLKDNENFVVDRSGEVKMLSHKNGDVLCRVCSLSYSPFDNAINLPIPGALESAGRDVEFHFSRVTDHAWIVQTGDNRAGMCIVKR